MKQNVGLLIDYPIRALNNVIYLRSEVCGGCGEYLGDYFSTYLDSSIANIYHLVNERTKPIKEKTPMLDVLSNKIIVISTIEDRCEECQETK